MSATYEEAIDQIFGRFSEVWAADSAAVVGYTPEVRWQGVEVGQLPDYGKYWVRVSQQTVLEGQSTLRDPSCGQRYRTNGLLFIQVFCPRSEGKSMENGRKLATIARNAYRAYSTSGGVWFRNARVSELEPEEKWIRLNVTVEYEYDETN